MIYDEGRALIDGIETPVQCLLMNLKKELSSFAAPHYHDYIELLFILNGRFKLIAGGNSYMCDEGDLAVINSREVHTLVPDGTDCRYIVVKFLPQILYASEQTLFEIKYMLPFTLNSHTHPRVINNAKAVYADIPRLMKSMLKEWDEQNYAYELAIRADILRLFSGILRYWNIEGFTSADYITEKSHLVKALQPALEYTSRNYITADAKSAADICGLSYSYFCRSFKEIMKKSFSEYLTYLKLSESEKLLISTDMSVTEIAQTCGFSTTSYFIQQFKKQKKFSPKKFRAVFTESRQP